MAARLDEIADGIAMVLGSSATPEPLRVDMWNQSPVNVAFFVRALAAACERRGAPLARIRVGTEIGERLMRAVEREPLGVLKSTWNWWKTSVLRLRSIDIDGIARCLSESVM